MSGIEIVGEGRVRMRSCAICGAMVRVELADLHEGFHEDLKTVLTQLLGRVARLEQKTISLNRIGQTYR